MPLKIFEMTARDIMSPRARTVPVNETIHNAIATMVDLGLSALPVVDAQSKCVGVLTKTDIIALTEKTEEQGAQSANAGLAALYYGIGIEEITNAVVEDVMTEDVLVVQAKESIRNVAKQMLDYEVHHVPVCDAGMRVVGMVSSMDLVKALFEAEYDDI